MKYLILLLILTCSVVNAQSHIEYKPGQIVEVNATVDKELQLKFPEPVMKARKSNHSQLMKGDLISNVYYVTPLRKFNERLIFKGVESGQIYPVDFSASSENFSDSVEIHFVSEGEEKGQNKRSKPVVTPIDLVQYAAQSLYSQDESMIEGVDGIRRVKLDQAQLDRTFYRGGDFIAKPYASWSSAGVYVTAVEMVNARTSELDWSVCNVRGDYLAVSPHSSTEEPVMRSGEAMMFYFVSDKPFGVAANAEGVQCLR